MKTKSINFDEKISTANIERNKLLERIEQQIPNELAELEQKVLHAASEGEISTLFAQIENLRRERREKSLLARRQNIIRLQTMIEKIQSQHEAKRTEWENALDQMPVKQEALELAKAALELQESLVNRLASTLSNLEREKHSVEVELNKVTLAGLSVTSES